MREKEKEINNFTQRREVAEKEKWRSAVVVWVNTEIGTDEKAIRRLKATPLSPGPIPLKQVQGDGGRRPDKGLQRSRSHRPPLGNMVDSYTEYIFEGFHIKSQNMEMLPEIIYIFFSKNQ